MRTLRALTVLSLFAAPLAAQDLPRPEGWQVRFDRPGSTEADLEQFVEMPPGWHITTGPSAIFWHPETTASGGFRAELEVYLFDPQGRREAFGMIFGGSNLEGADQAYTYFLLRDGGQYIVKRRVGAEAPTVVPWTSNDAILGYADRGEDVSVKNVLTVEVRGDTVRFMVNGARVAEVPRSAVDTDGIVGIRVNHRLNLHISRLEVEPLD